MAKDLTGSLHERQNIFNNRYALQKAEQHLALGDIQFSGEMLFIKQRLMELFDISDATVERYLSSCGDELKANGCTLLKGIKLK